MKIFKFFKKDIKLTEKKILENYTYKLCCLKLAKF